MNILKKYQNNKYIRLLIIMVCYKYINGERYILPDNREAKKQNFNIDIQDSLNKLLGACTAEEKLLKTSSLDNEIKKQQIKKIRGFQRKLYKRYTFEI